MYTYIYIEREREREKKKERERKKERETEREKERERDRQRDRERDRETERVRERQRETETETNEAVVKRASGRLLKYKRNTRICYLSVACFTIKEGEADLMLYVYVTYLSHALRVCYLTVSCFTSVYDPHAVLQSLTCFSTSLLLLYVVLFALLQSVTCFSTLDSYLLYFRLYFSL